MQTFILLLYEGGLFVQSQTTSHTHTHTHTHRKLEESDKTIQLKMF